MNIEELQERYGLKTRRSLSNWLNAARIELEQDEKGVEYATPEQVEALDRVRKHLISGGSLKQYTPVSLAVVDNPKMEPVYQGIDAVHPEGDSPQDTALLLKVVEVLASQQQQSPLWFHKELEQAAERGWWLTGEEVRALVGVKPKGQTFERGCWQFVRVGKIGGAIAWRVNKRSE